MVWITKPIIIITPTHLWMVREVSYPPKTLPSCLPQNVVKNRRLKPVADWIRNVNIRKRWNSRSTELKRLILVWVISSGIFRSISTVVSGSVTPDVVILFVITFIAFFILFNICCFGILFAIDVIVALIVSF